MNEIKLKKWNEMETAINNIFWHIQVAGENESELSKDIILSELNTIKSNYDYIDNH